MKSMSVRAFAGTAPAANMERPETNASAIEVRLYKVCNVYPRRLCGYLQVHFTL
jgi:hypothetical protein